MSPPSFRFERAPRQPDLYVCNSWLRKAWKLDKPVLML
jgi:hypothetical protein